MKFLVYNALRQIIDKRDKLIDTLERRLSQKTETLFAIRRSVE